MDITYRPIELEDYDQVRQLLVDAGWQKRVTGPGRFERIVQGANRTVVALDGTRVVGFARALFDGASNGYISTVAVASERQGCGIGRELVKRLMDVENPDQIDMGVEGGARKRWFLEEDGIQDVRDSDGGCPKVVGAVTAP